MAGAPPAEPEAHHSHQIVRKADLRGRVALEREDRILALHAVAIVAHADDRAPAILDGHSTVVDCAIDGVLHQLLDHGAGRSTTRPPRSDRRRRSAKWRCDAPPEAIGRRGKPSIARDRDQHRTSTQPSRHSGAGRAPLPAPAQAPRHVHRMQGQDGISAERGSARSMVVPRPRDVARGEPFVQNDRACRKEQRTGCERECGTPANAGAAFRASARSQAPIQSAATAIRTNDVGTGDPGERQDPGD